MRPQAVIRRMATHTADNATAHPPYEDCFGKLPFAYQVRRILLSCAPTLITLEPDREKPPSGMTF